MYVDSHAHLDLADFDPDREAVIERAREAELKYVLLIADLARQESVSAVRELAERYEGFYWAAGIDPHQAAEARQEHFEALLKVAAHPKFVAVGEIGLDYYHDRAPRDLQKEVFLRQLSLARALDRPLIIHCREAWSGLREILRHHFASKAGAGPVSTGELSDAARDGRAGVLHCFTGSADDARELMALGFNVSFAGNLTFKKAENLRELARAIPADRLLSETDSPYLAPVPYRGRRNEPAWVRQVTRELAGLQGMPEPEMGRRITDNFARLFRPERAPSDHGCL
jgi:TatD DNase family protein